MVTRVKDMLNLMDLVPVLVCAVIFVSLLPIIVELAENESNRNTRPRKRKRMVDWNAPPKYLVLDKISERLAFLERITQESNMECFKNLRMSKQAFTELCRVLRVECGLSDDQYVSVVEKVAIFLRTLVHHQKNRILQTDFHRSGQTISQAFHQVLRAVLKLRSRLLLPPTPVDEKTTDKRWEFFKGCVGALDGTYIPMHIQVEDQPRYRTRKGHLATNVLGVCDTKGRFVYMLVGWEGSASDGRVLRDAITRPNGLMVQKGTYYLCDSGYFNCEGFLAPYRQTRYHLQEWGASTYLPQNKKELFNLRHATAHNVIERAFGILKKRFAVLRSPMYYHINTQCDIILACGLLHNFVINVTPFDPLLDPVENHISGAEEPNNALNDIEDHIQTVNSSPGWTQFREQLADEIWKNYQSRC